MAARHLVLFWAASCAGVDAQHNLTTFFWNVHYECSLAIGGASTSCKQRVGSRFAELAQQSNAEVVAAIELSDSPHLPANLTNFGLSGWTQADGSCAHAWGFGDAVALAFAPGWQVVRSDGGCLRHDGDTRAFAVALAVPPPEVDVGGCTSLCFIVVHAPHSQVTRGRELVHDVCGQAVQNCAIAMGDWNSESVSQHWGDLVGGQVPAYAEPNERTCCWPESQHYGVFDHIAHNINGARHAGFLVHDYQHLEENPIKQHRAVTAHVILPASYLGVDLAERDHGEM